MYTQTVKRAVTGPSPATAPLEVRVTGGLTDYETAVDWMETRAAAIRAGTAAECLWLVEHPPLYTAGTSAKMTDLRAPDRFPVYRSARGGQFTYHGPGQRVAYVMIDLTRRGRDVRRFVRDLEGWLMDTLAAFNIDSRTHPDRVGVWVDRTEPGGPAREDKIAAIGVRIRRWVSFHGIALNVEPELSHFDGIVPCGISADGLGVTSLVDLGHPVTMDEVDGVLINQFRQRFAPCPDPEVS
ncbi:MAG: lipoyl(octanoyl) transferase LipB [Pseudomonadota bacterium]